MVLPKRRGVEMRTSEARLFHELARRISACCCAKVPGFSILKNVRVHAESVFKCVRCAVSMVYEFEEDPLSIQGNRKQRLATSRTFTDSRFENIVPENIGKTKKTFFLTVVLTDTHSRAPPTLLCLRYAHRHRLWARAATAPMPICRACTRICVAVRWTLAIAVYDACPAPM